MIRFRRRMSALRAGLLWTLVALMLVTPVLGAIANSHAPIHADVHALAADADADSDGDCADQTPHPAGLARLAHELAHAWHHCGVVMAVLSTPVVKLLALPPTAPPSVDVPPSLAPALQGLFRPPIR